MKFYLIRVEQQLDAIDDLQIIEHDAPAGLIANEAGRGSSSLHHSAQIINFVSCFWLYFARADTLRKSFPFDAQSKSF